MKSLIEYVEAKLEDFNVREFCSVDGLVLSQLSYVYLDNLVPGLDSDSSFTRIGDLLKAECFENMFKGLLFPDNNKKLLFALAASPRFRNIKAGYYTNKLDHKEEKQFSAITFFLPDQTTFIAYRGTDMTLTGWKENLNMAFKSPVPAQEEGATYLNLIGEKVKGPLRVGGHSKGGNLAVYSSMYCLPEIQDRIINVYSFDGPGFKDSVFQNPEFLNIEDRIIKFLPQSSIVGMLLQCQERYKVVASNQWWSVSQHDPFTWLIDGDDFHYVKNVSNRSVNMNKTLNKWLSTLSDKERERYVDALYKAMEAINSASINDFSDIHINEITQILKSVKNIEPETRKILSATIRELIVLYIRNYQPPKRDRNE
jgi:ribosomal protein S17E